MTPRVKYADLNQKGPFYYLAKSKVGPVTRTISITSDKSLFFPITTTALINGIEVPSLGVVIHDETTARTLVYDDINKVPTTDLICTLDGSQVGPIVRTQSPKFNVSLRADNILGFPAGDWDQSYADGYWVKLSPLSVGKHELHFAAIGSSPEVYVQN